MEDYHRKIILDNIEKLINSTEYSALINECVRSRIISQIMRDGIENMSVADREKHRQLFIKLTKRGPKAYDALVDVLKRLEFHQAVKILRSGEHSGTKKGKDECRSIRELKSTIQYSESDGCVTSKQFNGDINSNGLRLEIYTDPVQPSIIKEVKKSTKAYYDPKTRTYPMEKKYRGVFFMVNIIEFKNKKDEPRNGAKVDRDNLIHLFRELGFDIFYYEDLSLEQFNMLLGRLLESSYVKRTECFIMALMTHGTMDSGTERIEFYDGSIEKLDNILEKFRNDYCPNLVGKPKIFFFPFCRGNISDRGIYLQRQQSVQKRTETDNVIVPSGLPTYSDILICYATVPGFKAHRDSKEGSWYVQMWCTIWADHAYDTHIEDLHKLVGEHVGTMYRSEDGKLQTSSRTEYGFNKALYLNPGFYNDSI